MNKQTEALRMAIEQLTGFAAGSGSIMPTEKVIQACEEALEQPAQDDIVEEQRKTIEALNMCIGGDGSTTTENITRIGRLEAEIESLKQPAQVTRLEVIDNNGRAYVNYGVDKLEFSYQDDGRTLKIFTNGVGGVLDQAGLELEWYNIGYDNGHNAGLAEGMNYD